MISTCSEFRGTEYIKPPEISNKIAWYQWQNHDNDKYSYNVIKCTGSVANYFEKLCFKIKFLIAYFLKHVQAKAFQEER